ncbi:MAG: hypothetical protein M1445_01785, partial [Bacteroidetes bacterium]|nr:hypothetical protein [Bacteroidota bacterium]
MKRRQFIQSGSLATFGTLLAPSIYGFPQPNRLDGSSIKKVLLIFKTHLDVGFTNLAGKVVSTYLNE